MSTSINRPNYIERLSVKYTNKRKEYINLKLCLLFNISVFPFTNDRGIE